MKTIFLLKNRILLVSFFLLPILSASMFANVQAEVNNKNSYQTELKRVDDDVFRAIALSELHSGSWLYLEQLANAHMVRAKLTGNVSDYIEAQSALEKAFAMAKYGAGPFLTRASLNFSLHRNNLVEQDLVRAEDALLVSDKDKQKIDALRADVALYNGRYDEAKASYERTEKAFRNTASATRLANYFTQTGNYEQSQQWLRHAEKRITGPSVQLRSWIHLQHGLNELEQGQYDAAMGHYQQALAILPGHWLIEEHIAEIYALQGKLSTAEEQYRKLVESTNAPEFMVALADVLSESDQRNLVVEAELWYNKATDRFMSQRKKMPELVAGHASDYFLQRGSNKLALELAQNNYQARPAGEAALILAKALASNLKNTQASKLLTELLDSQYRSADLFITAAVVARSLGDFDLAVSYEHQALAINPHALTDT